MSRRGTLAEEGKSRIAIAVSDAMTTNAVPLNALQAEDLLGLVPRQLAAAGDGGATRRGMDEASLGLEEPRAPGAGALRAGRRGDARTCDRARDVYRRGAHPGVGCEARRARACGEHCRVSFRRCQKSPLAAVARARSGSRSTSFVSPVRSFADPVNVPNLAEQSVWKYSKSPLKKASVSEGGRRPDAWCRSARAHARLDTRTARFSRNGASRNRAGRFSRDPNPEFGRRPIAARVPRPPRARASSRRTLSLRVLRNGDRSTPP